MNSVLSTFQHISTIRCGATYKSISHFSVETAGTFDGDAEMKIYISSNPNPIEREFKRGADIIGVQRTLAQYLL
jgi:hypothetical protein